MKNLLYIQASPRQQRSKSITVADTFINAYRNNNPEDKIDTLNLFQDNIPPFEGLAVQAKYTILHGKKHTEPEIQAWKIIEKTISRFTAADKYVLAVPMWNFGIPYRLKQYIDILVQPGYTFTYSDQKGYQGLVLEKPLLTIYARGGEYAPGTDTEAFDLQKKYIDLIFAFIGFKDIKSIIIEPTLQAGPDIAYKKTETAKQKATQIAKTF